MTKKTKKLALLGGMLILAAALAVPALAGWRGGWDDDYMMGPRGWYGGPMMGPRWGAGLSAEESQELERAATDFSNDTLALRQQMAQKETELQALMLDPEATNEAISAKLSQVNGLRAELSQKQLLHQRDLQKRFPQLGMGPGWGRGGRGMGPGWGWGGRGMGGGFCAGPGLDWDRGWGRGY